jgi:hypothetical protein
MTERAVALGFNRERNLTRFCGSGMDKTILANW